MVFIVSWEWMIMNLHTGKEIENCLLIENTLQIMIYHNAKRDETHYVLCQQNVFGKCKQLLRQPCTMPCYHYKEQGHFLPSLSRYASKHHIWQVLFHLSSSFPVLLLIFFLTCHWLLAVHVYKYIHEELRAFILLLFM